MARRPLIDVEARDPALAKLEGGTVLGTGQQHGDESAEMRLMADECDQTLRSRRQDLERLRWFSIGLELLARNGRRPSGLLRKDLRRLPCPRQRARQHDIDGRNESPQPSRGPAEPFLTIFGELTIAVVRPACGIAIERDGVTNDDEIRLDQPTIGTTPARRRRSITRFSCFQRLPSIAFNAPGTRRRRAAAFRL